MRDVHQLNHSDSEGLASLINYPDLIELQTLDEINAIFKKDGSHQMHDDPDTITRGAYEGLVNTAFMITKDRKVIRITIGKEGHHDIRLLVQDTDHPTAKEIEHLQALLVGIEGFAKASKKFEVYVKACNVVVPEKMIPTIQGVISNALQKVIKKFL